MTKRNGFTLVELLVGLVMLLAVSGVIYRVLVTSQRVSRGQVEQSNLQSNVRSGVLMLVNELREIGYDSATDKAAAATDFRPDLLVMDNDTIRYRAMRGWGVACDYEESPWEIFIEKPLYSYREPKVGDTLLVHADHNPNVAADDEWFHLGVIDVDPNSTCPGGEEAYRLVVGGDGSLLTGSSGWGLGGPVRFSEVMEMGIYESEGQFWLGARSVSGGEASYQPVLGPLQAGGLQFRYLRADGSTTTDPRLVRTIEITLGGRTVGRTTLAGSNAATAEANMNLTTRVALRNALRP